MTHRTLVLRTTIFLTALVLGLVYVGSGDPAALALVLGVSIVAAWTPAFVLVVLSRRAEPWFPWLRRAVLAATTTIVIYVYLATSESWLSALGIGLAGGVAATVVVEGLALAQLVKGRI